jgi:ribonuclease BN (tRNA processing enzyme)
MQVVVLGGSGTFPRAGGACNGYLVRQGATNILIDMGTGVLSRLYDWIDPGELDALIITHLHPDHFLDIYPYRYFLEFRAAGRLPLPVFAPAGAADHIRHLFNEPDTAKFDRVFAFTDLASASDFRVGELVFAGKPVAHLEPTYGISVEAGGRRLFYTSDTDYDERLSGYAEDVDLLLAETTFRAEDADIPVPHMTTTEVARLATGARVSRLVLTHLWPHYDRAQIESEVAAGFDGKIYLADEGLLIEV